MDRLPKSVEAPFQQRRLCLDFLLGQALLMSLEGPHRHRPARRTSRPRATELYEAQGNSSGKLAVQILGWTKIMSFILASRVLGSSVLGLQGFSAALWLPNLAPLRAPTFLNPKPKQASS